MLLSVPWNLQMKLDRLVSQVLCLIERPKYFTCLHHCRLLHYRLIQHSQMCDGCLQIYHNSFSLGHIYVSLITKFTTFWAVFERHNSCIITVQYHQQENYIHRILMQQICHNPNISTVQWDRLHRQQTKMKTRNVGHCPTWWSPCRI